MPELRLDGDGERRLIDWYQTGPSIEDILLIEEVLDCYAADGPVTCRWYTADIIGTDDLIIYPRNGLRVVVHRYSAEDPETMFTVRAVQSDPHDVDRWTC